MFFEKGSGAVLRKLKKMKERKIIVSIAIFIIVLVGLFFILRDGKPSDQQAYEEVVATMSMEKAKRFFDEYPHSEFRDKLIGEIIGWCKREETEECYRMILDAIPKDHIQYSEVSSYYEKHYQKEGFKAHGEE